MLFTILGGLQSVSEPPAQFLQTAKKCIQFITKCSSLNLKSHKCNHLVFSIINALPLPTYYGKRFIWCARLTQHISIIKITFNFYVKRMLTKVFVQRMVCALYLETPTTRHLMENSSVSKVHANIN